MGSFRQWWRRAAAAVKDRRSLLMARVRPRGAWQWHRRELEAAVIRATSHVERWVDYRSAGRVFQWAWISPSLVRPVVWALGRRARRTRCWAMALKALMLAHGMLVLSGASPRAARVGRVPFELTDFRDRLAPPTKSPAFSAFLRAYFRFLDYRSLLAAEEDIAGDGDGDGADGTDHGVVLLDQVTKLQFLLELLLQIRPYGDGMEVPLVLESMDCALIEIFQVYSEICTGVARFLVGVPVPTTPRPNKSTAAAGIRVLWKAAEQSAQLSSYFELCRSLGVVNACRLPAFERVRELERLLTSHDADEEAEGDGSPPPVDPTDMGLVASSAVATRTTTTTEWAAFDDEKPAQLGRGRRSAVASGTRSFWRRRTNERWLVRPVLYCCE